MSKFGDDRSSDLQDLVLKKRKKERYKAKDSSKSEWLVQPS